jgi:NADPH:quinone reductase-like Zn-dependent oxidoreductase
MKAAVNTRHGPPNVVVHITDVEKPAPKDNEILIRVRAAGINPLDWRLMQGGPYIVRMLLGLGKPKIKRPGVDVSGQVETVGRNVVHFKPGDAVFGMCKGTFAEYVCASESAFVIKPGNISFEQAASVPVAALTALQGLRDKGKIQPGQKVLIKCGRRRRYLRRADRQVVRRRGYCRMQHQKCGHGPIYRSGSRH